MKKLGLLFLAVVVSFSISGAAFAENLKKGDVVYAKYSMRGKGKELFWHNMSSMPVVLPAGAEVTIVAIGPEKVVLENADKKLQLLANTVQWDKYFVMNKNDVKVADATEAKEGMSKEEVYSALGCPSYTGYGVKSYFKSMQDVMASDTWYYNATTKAIGVLVKFENGKVKSAEKYRAGKK